MLPGFRWERRREGRPTPWSTTAWGPGDHRPRLPGARSLAAFLAPVGPGGLVRSLARGRGGDGLPRLPRAWCDPELRAPPAGLDGVQAVGTARSMAGARRPILDTSRRRVPRRARR